MMLWLPWMLSLTAYVLHWPVWVHGISGTLAFFFIVGFIYREATEDGVDVVKRD